MDKPSYDKSNDNPPQTQEKIPHGGEEPDVKGLGPLTPDMEARLKSELAARTTIPDALIGKTLIEDAANHLSQIDSDQQEVETQPKKKKLGIIIGGGAAAIALAAGAAFAVNATNADPNEGSKPVPTMSDGPKGGVIETLPATPSPVETKPAKVDRAKELGAMGISEFNALDRQQKLIYVGEILKKNPIELAQKNGDQYLELFNPLDIASRDNDANQIIQQYWYLKQTALAQRSGDETTSLLDKEKARKALAGGYYYSGSEALVSGDYNNMLELIDSSTNTAQLASRYTATGASELENGTDRYGNQVEYKDVSFTTEQGINYVGRFIYTTYTTNSGKDAGIWQLVGSVSPDEVNQLNSIM